MDALIKLFSDPQQAQVVLQSISNYITYIYPGIISLYWNNFLEAKTTRDTHALLIKSFSISFLYNIFLHAIFDAMKLQENIVVYNIELIAISIVCPYIYCKLKNSTISETVCNFLGIRTCILDVPYELLKTETENYTCLKIYLTDNFTSYVGYMDTYEYEKDREQFIILVSYKKYILENNIERLVINNCKEQSDQKVFIKYSEIKVIEKIAEDIADNAIYNSCRTADENGKP